MSQRIFISSVQREFAKERKALAEYVRKDAILGRFFDVFLERFECREDARLHPHGPREAAVPSSRERADRAAPYGS